MTPGTGTLQDVVTAVLDADGYLYHVLEGSGVALRIRDEQATYDVFVTTDEEHRTATVHVAHPVRVPQPRRVAVGELLARLGWRTPVGALELDFADGELRWRQTHLLGEGALQPAMVRQAIGYGLLVCERFHTAVLRVAYGWIDPEVAVLELEG